MWKTTGIVGGAALLLIGSAIVFYFVFFTTPHMRVQEKIRSFQAVMPTAPARSIPLEQDSAGREDGFPDFRLSIGPAAKNLATGAVYYGYYCVYCHGEKGDGEGRVGQSYMPTPADLRTKRLREISDSDLLRAMLRGTGHEPVINRVVQPDFYQHLVLYVRELNRKGAPETNTAGAPGTQGPAGPGPRENRERAAAGRLED